MVMKEDLVRLCLKHGNDGNEVYQALVNREMVDETIDISKYNFISILDYEYPKQLKQTLLGLHKSFVLYYEGDKELLNNIDDMIFLYGENKFNLPEEKLITIKDCVVDIGGRLKVWFNKEPKNPHRFILAACMCKKMVITKEYSLVNKSFITLSAVTMLNNGGDIYITPTRERSWNNKLIKEGAFLIDCAEDLEANKW